MLSMTTLITCPLLSLLQRIPTDHCPDHTSLLSIPHLSTLTPLLFVYFLPPAHPLSPLLPSPLCLFFFTFFFLFYVEVCGTDNINYQNEIQLHKMEWLDCKVSGLGTISPGTGSKKGQLQKQNIQPGIHPIPRKFRWIDLFPSVWRLRIIIDSNQTLNANSMTSLNLHSYFEHAPHFPLPLLSVKAYSHQHPSLSFVPLLQPNTIIHPSPFPLLLNCIISGC